ncbi:patched domain-containing protein 3-like [Centruroides vittatus]|uniref:patched domain-containing protein 3-like n=1 Tax=Centruroides vittatus TaxID=120091 RepID=UPI00350FA6E4
MNIRCFQQILSSQFSRLGRLIGRQPLYFLIVPILLTVLFCPSVVKLKINRDADYLFMAQNGRAHRSKNIVESFFPMNTSGFFDVARILERKDIIILQIIAKDGGTLLKEEISKEIKRLDETVQNITVESEVSIVKYTDLCAYRLNKCLRNSLLQTMSHFEDISKGRQNIKFPLHIDNVTFYFEPSMLYIGNVDLNKQGFVREIKAARLFYGLDTDNSTKTILINQWQRKLVKMIESKIFDNIIVNVLSSEDVEEELAAFSQIVLPLISVVIATVSVFSFISCMSNDWLRSKPWLGISACISAGLAIISGYGLTLYMDIECLDFIPASAYIVLSTEIDDAFVLIAAWRKTNSKKSVEDRMGETFSEAAISITITSLTNIISFCIGVSSPFPSMRIFCSFSASAMFFTYIYQLTFFGACIALSGYREKHELHPFTFRKLSITEQKKEESKQEDYFMAFFRDKLGDILINNKVKAVVIIAFMLNLGIGIWGLLEIHPGGNIFDLFKHNSSVTCFANSLYQDFGKYSYPVHIVFNQPLNYADENVQNAIEDIIKKFEEHPHIADSSLRLSWLKYYKLFMAHPIGKFLLRGYNMTDKQDFIDGLRFVFLKFHQAREFALDVAFNENFTDIIASRFLVPTMDIYNQDTELQLLKDLNDIVDNSPIPIVIHSFLFHLLEQANIIMGMTVRVALLSAALISLIFFIFVPNFTCSLCVSSIIFCIILETIGYISLWKVSLDMLTVTIFILCVGFSINYPTHISFVFTRTDNLSSNERIKKALYEVGFPIMQGSLSTIIGVLALAFLPFYVTQGIFKIYFSDSFTNCISFTVCHSSIS